MKEADAELFFPAMQKEISDHKSHDHWTIVKRSYVQPWTNTIQYIWSFKRNRFPGGWLNKHKARICDES